ncbi:MAG: hypothetical protein SCK28_07625 [Bacillota bacterium]|nr:hypothetical protein [Bacillota bacterium]
MDLIAELALIASLVQICNQMIKKAVLEHVLQTVPDWLDQLSVLIISFIIAFFTKSDLLQLLDSTILNPQLDTPPWLGQILFALLISRGSSGVHDLLDLLEKRKAYLLSNNSENLKSKKNTFRFW